MVVLTIHSWLAFDLSFVFSAIQHVCLAWHETLRFVVLCLTSGLLATRDVFVGRRPPEEEEGDPERPRGGGVPPDVGVARCGLLPAPSLMAATEDTTMPAGAPEGSPEGVVEATAEARGGGGVCTAGGADLTEDEGLALGEGTAPGADPVEATDEPEDPEPALGLALGL